MPNWRQVLLLTHRWLGVVGCLAFAAWFASGLVMIYARMPGLSHEEQLARAQALDLSRAQLSPAEAAARLYLPVDHIVVSMRGGRPVYLLGRGRGATIVYADSGELYPGVDADAAAAVAKPFAPAGATLSYLRYLTVPDQWTLQDRGRLPMHVFAADDAAGTRLYVSETAGTMALRSTRSERVWGFLGPVIHWMYFTPIRSRGGLWGELVIWTSLAGCVVALTGIAWGLLRYAPRQRYRLAGSQVASPYTGLLKWHHYAGLIFGIFTFTWIYSGLLSVEPFGWFDSEGVTTEQREVLAGGALPEDLLTLEHVRTAALELAEHGYPKEIETVMFRGALYWAAEWSWRSPSADGSWISDSSKPRAPARRLQREYVSGATAARRGAEFDRDAIVQAAREAVPGAHAVSEEWIDAYDGYYYDPTGSLELPVLRVKYDDGPATWLYLDPRRGAIVAKYQRASRVQRWLYHGLHSLDFPALYYRRPLWDVVIIGLSLGGLLSSLTAVVPAWRRVRRFVARGTAR